MLQRVRTVCCSNQELEQLGRARRVGTCPSGRVSEIQTPRIVTHAWPGVRSSRSVGDLEQRYSALLALLCSME